MNVAMGSLEYAVGCTCCGYPLHGLKPEGDCPECGHAVSRSLLETAQLLGSTAQTRTMASGWWLLAMGFAGSIISSFLFAAVFSVELSESKWRGSGVWVPACLLVVIWIPTVIVLLGVWRVTAAGSAASRLTGIAILARVFVTAWAVLWSLHAWLDIGYRVPRWAAIWERPEDAVVLAALLAGVAAWVFLWLHAEKVALRVAPRTLPARRWFVYAVAGPAAAVFVGLGLESHASRGPIKASVAVLLSVAYGIAWVLAAVGSWQLSRRLRALLRSAPAPT